MLKRMRSLSVAMSLLAFLSAILLNGCGSSNEKPATPAAKSPETGKANQPTTGEPAQPAETAKPVVLRMGHFPNVTHAQGLVAHYFSDQGNGWFEKRLGPKVKIEWYVYNAGPSAMEAILTKALDATYVGPNPALNAHIKSKGEEIRVVAGAATGGAALVVRRNGGIVTPEDFRGKKIATPQLGNTQDVSCRAWLTAHGFKVTLTGGNVSVIPTQNPDQLSLFAKGGIDAVWTVEPWVTRLETEAEGQVFFEETDALTTVLTCGADFLKKQPELAGKLVAAHRELTEWIAAHPDEARKAVVAELSALTHSTVSPDLIELAWKRLNFTDAIDRVDFEKFLAAAQSAGFLTEAGDLGRLVEIPK